MNLPKKGNIIGDYRFWQGSLRDFSSQANDLSVTAGTPYFKKGKYGTKLHRSSGDFIQSNSPSGYDGLSEITVIGYFAETQNDMNRYPNGRILSKRGAAGTFTFDFGIGGGGWGQYLEFDTEGCVNYIVPADNFLANNRSASATAKVGEKPKFYAGSTYLGASTQNDFTYINRNDALYIQSIYNGSGALDSGLMGALIYNVALSADEIAQVDEWITSQFTPSYPKKNFIVLSDITGD